MVLSTSSADWRNTRRTLIKNVITRFDQQMIGYIPELQKSLGFGQILFSQENIIN